jgi:predicted metal-dependent hydrolase
MTIDDTSTSRSIEVRNKHFDLDSVPCYWHGGQRSVTLFTNSLSIFFPPGERFFIASVKAYADRVKDEKLRREIKLFCGQEGMHSREHVAYNRMLDRQGYPASAMEKGVERLLRFLSRRLPPLEQLAVTCALEHFTAILAHRLLSDPKLSEGRHPVMAALWRWHAAEETEHKAVAFDVYRAAGGSYGLRALTMMVTTLIFWAYVSLHQVRLMWVDECLFSLREWVLLYRFLFVDPGAMRRILRPYLTYYRPSFHPWDHDNRALLDAWKDDFGSSPQYQKVREPSPYSRGGASASGAAVA